MGKSEGNQTNAAINKPCFADALNRPTLHYDLAVRRNRWNEINSMPNPFEWVGSRIYPSAALSELKQQVSFSIGWTQLLEPHSQGKQRWNPKKILAKICANNKAVHFFPLLFGGEREKVREGEYMRRWLKLECIEHSRRAREPFAHEELKMSRIQPSCELHLGGSERDRDGRKEGPRQAGRQAPKPWRGAFWHNDSHLPLTGLRKVKLIMTARRCWIAFDEVNHRQSKKTGVERFLIPPLKLYRAQTPLFKILFSLFFFPLVSVPHKATISLRFAASLPLFWLFSGK